ncbi:uncharacterized protein I303_106071 [Kwoniella dejecticola CBS 10117]|uniref:Uncharacterized protein n=1 Tax=Kwoniella dejecticola CBS 10117 TaxID=1296121 RepID=A0A1A6A173_9TREE|nr:uncharacterized protein I303_06091 [Kwoniella dejecticola CBS 10117]OBR83808.1 hypothetical protein I303_06091 [Kwoniella dejecticola CBS 10117]
MPHPDSVQLGTLFLGLSVELPSSSQPRWIPLIPSFIDSDNLFDNDSKDSVRMLRSALNDAGLGLQAEWIRQGRGIKVRCWILPSDVPGSMWKRIANRNREKTVEQLLKSIRRDWEVEDEQGDILMALMPQDNQSMQDIYSQVPSPPIPQFVNPDSISDRELFDSLQAYENPYGVQTDLYKYQIRSVSRMVKMEMQPERLVDPLFIPIQEAGRNDVYYLNMATWDIQRHPGWYDLPRGGILCEQMGTGKTLMCLSLITSTLYQPTLPPPINVDISPISTDVAERTYPFSADSDLRALTGFPRSRTHLKFPSLAELCSNVISTHDPSAKRNPYIPDMLRPALDRQTFYCTIPLDDECGRFVKKKTASQKVKKVYLAKGTLVIVPQILIHQWQAEIETHLEEGVLKVYHAVNEELPEIEELLDYDVILMDVLRFGAEETHHRRARDLKPSSLLKARWKRIILDEGHIAHSKISNSMAFSRELSVERRWLVSGTPTRHLQQGGEVEMEEMNASNFASTNGIQGQAHTNHQMESPGTTTPLAWNKLDLEDASRIGRMIGGFLAAEPFKTEGGFERNVITPLRNKEGPSFGAVRRMKYIMDGLMVKHGPKVIDLEAQLPPSTIVTEMLRFDPMQKITYNVLAALVASNVYTSGGEDVDYFLHKDNRESFLQVVDNLHLACFWYSAKDMGAAACLNRTQKWLEKHQDADTHVREQLEEAVRHLQLAVNSPEWEEWMSNGVSMPLDGHCFPPLVKTSWSDSFDSDPNMVDVHSFNTLREINKPGTTVQELHIRGWDYRNDKLAEFQKEMNKYMEKHAKEQKKLSKAPNSTAAKAPKAVLKSSSSPKKSASRKKRKDRDEVDENLDEAQRNALIAAAVANPTIPDLPRPLPSVMQTKSRSAKANFIARTILSAEKDDKFVIFGDAYELGHLTELLDLLDITSTFVGSELFTRDRRKALDDFQKPEIKICLLDLKVGARGLNLVVANRVIFLRPIWSPDVQAQAIKRVHRIGQTKPTTIQILVTEGTFEEDIAKRSTRNRSQADEQLYSIAMIKNPKFVYQEREEVQTFTVRFTPASERTASGSVPNGHIVNGDKSHNVAQHLEDPSTPSSNSDYNIGTNHHDDRAFNGPTNGNPDLSEENTRKKKRARVMFA